MQPPSDWTTYCWIVVGVFVSLVMPIVRQLAVPPPGLPHGFRAVVQHIWPTARPYVFMGIFSFMAAIVILAGVRVKTLQIDSKWGAFLLGYFCDATIQKLKP